jgi:hypothetical protein
MKLVGQVSVAGVVTHYGLRGPGIKPDGARFSVPIQTGPGAHLASYTRGTGSHTWGKAGGVWH